MNFKKDNKIFEEIIIETGKAMLSDSQDPWLFAELLNSKDYENAYKMLSESQKSKYTSHLQINRIKNIKLKYRKNIS